MAFDEELGDRVRALLASEPGVTERRMFGGLAFMVDGNMTVGVIGEDLMVRVGVDGHADALAQAHARPMDFTGRASRGMIYVDPAGTASDTALGSWVARGVAFARSLPPK